MADKVNSVRCVQCRRRIGRSDRRVNLSIANSSTGPGRRFAAYCLDCCPVLLPGEDVPF